MSKRFVPLIMLVITLFVLNTVGGVSAQETPPATIPATLPATLPATVQATSTASETPVPAVTLTPSPTSNASPTVPATSTPISSPTSAPKLKPSNTPVNSPTLAASPFALGITVDLVTPDSANAVRDLGVTWARLTVKWKDVEKIRGTRDYQALDQAVNALNGLKLLLTVTAAPDWARSSVNEDGPPTDFAQFGQFMKDLSARYKGKIHAYEIWTEPNLRRNWNGQPLGAAGYVKLIRTAHAAIKASDSGALVISAGLSPTGFNDGKNAIDDRVFLRDAYQAGLAAVADGIGAHPFGWGNPADSVCCLAAPGVTHWFDSRSFYFRDTLTDYYQIMTAAKDTKTLLWVTAFGWGSADGVSAPETVNEASFGFVKFVDQAKQAEYTARAISIGKLAGFVGPMFGFSLNACAVNSNPAEIGFYPCYYALLDGGGKARPVYEAFKAAAR